MDDTPAETALPEATALADRPTDVRMRIECFAVAVAVPDHEDIDPVEYGGRTILDALSLHGITVAGVAHHDDPGPLFPKGFDGTGGPTEATAGTVPTGGDSRADAAADPGTEVPTDEAVVETVDETGSTSGSPRDR